MWINSDVNIYSTGYVSIFPCSIILYPFLPLRHNITHDPKAICFAYLIVVCSFVYNAWKICVLSPLHTPQLFHTGTPKL